jgi:hypothetical protein
LHSARISERLIYIRCSASAHVVVVRIRPGRCGKAAIMNRELKTKAELRCLDCEHCQSCKSDHAIYCKHPFVVRRIECRPEWKTVYLGDPKRRTPEWCPNVANATYAVVLPLFA